MRPYEQGTWAALKQAKADFGEDLHVRRPVAEVRRRGVRFWLGVLLDPSLRACFLLRLTLAGPSWAHWLGRNALVSLHAIDIGRGAKIGPGLSLPHPVGVVIGEGVRMGTGLTIYQHVTLGQKGGSYPLLGDGVTVFPGAVVVGDIEVGAHAVIGANAFLDRSVASETVFAGRG